MMRRAMEHDMVRGVALCLVLGTAMASAAPVNVFVGLDGSKQPQDLGVNANLGVRAAVDTAVLVREGGAFGVQAGVAVNAARNAVAVLPALDGTDDRVQGFATAGLYHQDVDGWSAGLVVDVLESSYYDEFRLAQARGLVARRCGAADWFGVWGAVGIEDDAARFGETVVQLEVLDQVALLWRRLWSSGVRTTVWAGAAEAHDEVVYVFDAETDGRTGTAFTYGASLWAPLNAAWAIVGEAHFVSPADSGTVDATLGVAWFPGDRARPSGVDPRMPLLPVANNATFAVNLAR